MVPTAGALVPVIRKRLSVTLYGNTEIACESATDDPLHYIRFGNFIAAAPQPAFRVVDRHYSALQESKRYGNGN